MAQKKTTSANAKPTKPKASSPAAGNKVAPASAKSASARRSASASVRGSSSKTSVASGANAVKAKSAAAEPKSASAVAKAAATVDGGSPKAETKKVAAAAAKAAPSRVKTAKPGASQAASKAAASAKSEAVKKPSTKAKSATGASRGAKASSANSKSSGKVVPAVANAAVATGAAARAVAASIAEAAARKISQPVKPVKTPKAIAEKAAQQRDCAQQKKAVSQRHGFKTNEHVVYPAHGVGRIIGIEEQEIAGMSLELFVINFEKEKLTLRVPTGKLESVGLRKLAEGNTVDKALDVLKGRARVKRTMWSRRAQEYVAKINSGDLIAIAEVVRDLYRSEAQPEQSYSERQLYEDALDRMAREVAAVCKLDERGAIQKITDVLARSARNRKTTEDEAAGLEGDANEAA